MAIVLLSGSFQAVTAPTSIMTDQGGLVSPDLYSVSTPTFKAGTLLNGITAVFSEAPGFLSGDEVLIQYGAKITVNIINSVSADGLTVEFSNRTPINSGSIQVKKRLLEVSITEDFEAGVYRILPTNEKLVAIESFNNPYITTTELGGNYPDAYSIDYGKEVNANRVGITKVYSDLDGIDNIYNAVWFDRIKQLKIAAMLVQLFPHDGNLRVDYKELLSQTRTVEIVNEDKEIVSDFAVSDWGYF